MSGNNVVKTGQYVVFSLEEKLFGVSIDEVIEIIRIQNITDVPGIANYIMGMINLRGKIIPVIHFRIRYQLEKIPFTKKARIIIVESSNESIGIIVDEVKMVTLVEGSEVEPPNELFNVVEKDCFKGFAKHDDEVIGLFNIEKVLYPN